MQEREREREWERENVGGLPAAMIYLSCSLWEWWRALLVNSSYSQNMACLALLILRCFSHLSLTFSQLQEVLPLISQYWVYCLIICIVFHGLFEDALLSGWVKFNQSLTWQVSKILLWKSLFHFFFYNEKRSNKKFWIFDIQLQKLVRISFFRLLKTKIELLTSEIEYRKSNYFLLLK